MIYIVMYANKKHIKSIVTYNINYIYIYIYQKIYVRTSNFSTYVCNTLNEQVVATSTSVIEGGIDASIDDLDALSGHISYKQ